MRKHAYVPAIHAFLAARPPQDVDARDKRGHDAEGVALLYNVHSRPFCVKSRIRRSSIPLVPAKAGTQFLRKSAGSPLARG